MTRTAAHDTARPAPRRGPQLRLLGLGVAIPLTILALRATALAEEWPRQVSLAGLTLPATRIVSLAPNITETLQAIDAAQQVVAYSMFCKLQLKFPPRPVAGLFNQPDHAAVRALKPDVVLFSEHARPEDLKQLDEAGLRYLVLPAGNIADIVGNVRVLGTLTGKTEKAEQVAGEIERIVADARARVQTLDPARRPRVFLEVDGPDPLYTAGAASFISEMVHLAGGVNVFADRPGPYPVVTSDEVVAADPEHIFIGGFLKSADELRTRPGWDRISAVRNGKVRAGVWDLWLLLWRPGSSVGLTIQKLARELGTAPPASPPQEPGGR